ncbi:MAG: hypothetical protein Q8K60_06100 [Parachlamydiaceae bacterium]|nr:hypothetical protein [Parachlamydiaceae bacterium]
MNNNLIIDNSNNNFDQYINAVHYFDENAKCQKKDVIIGETDLPLQTANVFYVKNLFLKFNPFKKNLHTNHIIYQHCILCGKKRFTDDQFKKIYEIFNQKALAGMEDQHETESFITCKFDLNLQNEKCPFILKPLNVHQQETIESALFIDKIDNLEFIDFFQQI